MKAYCYFQPIDDPQFDQHAELVRRWKASWMRAGWDVVVLTERNARCHPAWAWFHAKIKDLPTVNPVAYENACFLRWLALATEMRPGEVAVFGDYDVLNLGFRPGDAVRIHNPGQPVNTDINFGMGPFVLSHQQAQAIPPLMVAVTAMLRKYVNPTGNHWADMEMWKANQYAEIGWQQTVPLCLEYAPDVQAPLVHITYSAANRFGTTKLEAWKQLEERHVA